MNQPTLNATQGATALNMDITVEPNKIGENVESNTKIENFTQDSFLDDISIENATYLQNTQAVNNNSDSLSESIDEKPNFEVDSIELATPELYSSDEEFSSINQDEENTTELFDNPRVPENSEALQNKVKITKEPEMFEEPNFEENFEIPAFLRRQKN